METEQRRPKAKTVINLNGLVVDQDDIAPQEDRTFRAGWNLSGSAIAIDMGKARDIWRDRLRAARKPLLEALDIAFQRAFEKKVYGDADQANYEMTTIISRKQALRDAPYDPRIAAAQTPEQLKALTLDVLIGN